jgi:hypothetical protein
MCKIGRLLLSVTAALVALAGSGCKTAAPKPSGFLSDYSHLQQVNDSTWRCLDSSRLGTYSAFTIAPVKIMVKEYWGTTFNADQQQRLASMFRQKIQNALSGRYQVVGTPGPNTAEIRVALTQAYRVGNALGLGVEAEIVDPTSHQQLAAVRGVRIGPPEVGFRMGSQNTTGVGGDYMAAWWNLPSAAALMDQWSDQIRDIIEEAHKR